MNDKEIQGHGVLGSLQKAYRKKIRSSLRSGLMLTLAITISVVAFSGILELISNFGVVGRTTLFLLSLITCLIATGRIILPNLVRYFRGPGPDEIAAVALEAGQYIPGLRDRLRNAVELMSQDQKNLYSEELIHEYVETIFRSAARYPIVSSLKFRIGTKPKLYLGGSFMASVILLALFPSQLPSSLAKITNFTREYAAPAAFTISVEPGNVLLSRGDTLNLTISLGLLAARKFPSYVTVNEKYEGEQEFEKHHVKQVEPGEYFLRLPNIRNRLDYFVTAVNERSEYYRVNVVDLPIVQNFTITLVYPGYTHKGIETLQQDIGDFTAPVGTKAEYALTTNKNLEGAWINFSNQSGPADTSRLGLHVVANSASGSFVVTHNVSYTLRLLDVDSLRNRDPISYSVQAVEDQYPTCRITYPGKDIDIGRDMQLPLTIEIGDDYGFTKLLLQYKLTSSKYVPPEKDYHSLEITLPSKAAGQEEISYNWDLSSLNLVPEDVVSYHATVFDDDMVKGPKSTTSSEYTVRLPSLNEVFAQTDSEHSDLISKTEEALKLSDNLNQEFQRMSEDMKTLDKQMSWEQQKKMQSTIAKFDSLQKRVNDLKQKAESMTEKMLENKLLSPETLEKYLELEKAIQEINSPEFQEALQKLQQAMSSLNPEQVRQAVQNFKVNEEALRKSIERTLSLIKRVEIEQKLDEVQKRTADMINQQDSLRVSTARSDSGSTGDKQDLSEKQYEVRKELSNTQQEMSGLKSMMDQFPNEMPVGKLQEAARGLSDSGTDQKMQSSARQLSRGDFAGSMNSQRQISAALQQFQRQISETQKEMLRNQQRETVNALRKAQQNLLQISKEQQDLRDQSERSMEPNSPGARSLASKQYELMQQLNYTAQQMMQLSDKSFAVTPQMGRQIGEAHSYMNEALNSLQNRFGQTNSATGPQKQAMGSMNKAVMNIQNTLQSMSQGQGGAGNFPSLLQQLQQLAGQQEDLNALTRQLGEGGELSLQQQSELSRLAAQQQIIRKSLEQLNSEFQRSQSRGQVLGDLNAVSEEMKKVEKDMDSKNITQQTIQRQNKILSRMLDASRSINRQDFDNKRVSKAGNNVFQPNPSPLNLSNSNSEIDEELLKLIRKNFPPEYQKVILRYYQLLKKTPE